LPKRIGLRAVAAALVLAIVAPLGVLAVVSIQRAWHRQLTNVDRQNVANVHAISVAIDQQVERTTSALDVLGELHALDTPELPAFESLASRILRYQPYWSAILLADPSGTVIDGIPDRFDGGATANGMNWARAAVEAKQTTVSSVFRVPGNDRPHVIIAVPVVRNGRITLILGARVATRALGETLQRQEISGDGTIVLIGNDYRVIARSRDEHETVGTPANPEFVEVARRSAEGTLRLTARDGRPNYAAFSRSSKTGLVVALGFPAEQVDGPIRRILWTVAAAWVVVLGIGASLGMLFGGAIVRAMSAASAAATALARGEAVVPRPSRIAEIDDLADALRRASDILQQRNRERDEASRLKDEFLMTVSHELRTPLTAILGWARMLVTGQIRDEQRARAIESIERNALALQQLVEDLLDVSRIVTGKLRLEVQAVAIADVIAAAVDTIRPAAEAKGIRLRTSVETTAAVVSGDSGRLQQVVWNLLSNAVRFTPHGGRIDVECSRVDSTVELVVRDSGVGIDPDFLPHVFERFRQAGGAGARAHGGLGLGLSIVRHLVELHGGTVTAANNSPRPGATFRVTFPAASAAMYSGSGPAERTLPAPSASLPTTPSSAAG
jgi:signal transduction histidine kinase